MKKYLLFVFFAIVVQTLFGQEKKETIYKVAGGHITLEKYTVRGEDNSKYAIFARDQRYKKIISLIGIHFDSSTLSEVIEQLEEILSLFKDMDKDESMEVEIGDQKFGMSIMSNLGVKSIWLSQRNVAGSPHFWITSKQVKNIIDKLEKEI